jgi:hypothetical protein
MVWTLGAAFGWHGTNGALRSHQKSRGVPDHSTEVKDMKKLSLKKLEKRIAPRYMPFGS